jgi:DNA-binding CsgD family transcriptional regulator
MIHFDMRLQELNDVVASTTDPAFAVDGAGSISAWNSAAEAMFALSACEAIGRQCHEVVNGTDECGAVCSADCAVGKAVAKRKPVGNFDLQIQTAHGLQWCNVAVLAADGENGGGGRYSIHTLCRNDFRTRLDLLVRELLVRDFVVTGAGLAGEQLTARVAFTRALPTRQDNLSARELEVLKLLAKGVTATAIAALLHLSRITVKNHVSHILHKLHSHTRMEAIRRAEKAGLI